MYYARSFIKTLEREKLNTIYFCTELEDFRVLVLVKQREYKWKIFLSGISLDFWNWMDDFSYIPEIYKSFRDALFEIAFKREPETEVCGAILEADIFTQLENGLVHPHAVIESAGWEYINWADDITDIRNKFKNNESYRAQYGEWFVKVQQYFREYNERYKEE